MKTNKTNPRVFELEFFSCGGKYVSFTSEELAEHPLLRTDPEFRASYLARVTDESRQSCPLPDHDPDQPA